MRKNHFSSFERLYTILLAALLLAGCSAYSSSPAQEAPGYKQIDQDTAKQMMLLDDGHVIVDVRRQDEYDAGHIPGAILIPNESIVAYREPQQAGGAETGKYGIYQCLRIWRDQHLDRRNYGQRLC